MCSCKKLGVCRTLPSPLPLAHLMCSAPSSARTSAGTSTGGTCPYSSAVRMRASAAAAERPFSRLERCVSAAAKAASHFHRQLTMGCALRDTTSRKFRMITTTLTGESCANAHWDLCMAFLYCWHFYTDHNNRQQSLKWLAWDTTTWHGYAA